LFYSERRNVTTDNQTDASVPVTPSSTTNAIGMKNILSTEFDCIVLTFAFSYAVSTSIYVVFYKHNVCKHTEPDFW